MWRSVLCKKLKTPGRHRPIDLIDGLPFLCPALLCRGCTPRGRMTRRLELRDDFNQFGSCRSKASSRQRIRASDMGGSHGPSANHQLLLLLGRPELQCFMRCITPSLGVEDLSSTAALAGDVEYHLLSWLGPSARFLFISGISYAGFPLTRKRPKPDQHGLYRICLWIWKPA